MRCLICNNSHLRELSTTSDGKLYHHCEACGYTALDSSFYLSREEEKARYLLHENSLENRGYVEWLERFLKFALTEEAPEHAGRILDFGSGPRPVLTHLLKARGFQASCEDVFFAPRKVPGRFRLICAVEVMEHVFEPLEVFRALAVRLEEGGRLCLSTSFMPEGFTPARLELFEHWSYRSDATHVGFFTPKTLAVCAEKCGMVLSRCDNVSYAELKRPN